MNEIHKGIFEKSARTHHSYDTIGHNNPNLAQSQIVFNVHQAPMLPDQPNMNEICADISEKRAMTDGWTY